MSDIRNHQLRAGNLLEQHGESSGQWLLRVHLTAATELAPKRAATTRDRNIMNMK
jgi:hypothetical protein